MLPLTLSGAKQHTIMYEKMYENVRLYCQNCSRFGHVILDCKAPKSKEKEKVGSQ